VLRRSKPASADFFEGNLTMSANQHSSGRQGRLLTIWAPEDKSFWEREGEAIAKLNLWISVPALFLAFAIWQVWSVVAVSLPGLGFKYSTNQLFWLAARLRSRAPRCASSTRSWCRWLAAAAGQPSPPPRC
jgi:hypothetical protein